jgi:putative oxidoreductase
MDGDTRATLRAAGLASGRLLLAAIFLLEGWSKIRGYDAAAAYMARFGVPGVLLPAVIALELGGGLMIAVGWKARPAGLALAVFCVLTAILFHANITDRNQLLHFEKDLALAGGLLVLAVVGAGTWSLERDSAADAASARR